MSGNAWPGMLPLLWKLAITLLPVLVGASSAAAREPTDIESARPGPALDCQQCHGELELLRQHTRSLAEARQLLAFEDTLAASAHAGLTCGECHRGYRVYPHPRRGATLACGDCHRSADSAWTAGVHAARKDQPVLCRSCHGVHDVRALAGHADTAGVAAMNARCLGCHELAALPPSSPHARAVACAACHGSHDVDPIDAAAGRLAPMLQAGTCGACHDSIAGLWRGDAHGRAAARRTANPPGQAPAPPTCTTCHGGHDLQSAAGAGSRLVELDRCAGCHESYADRFADSYHGQAATLGSAAAATCADCHGGHGVLPAADPHSTVAPGRLIDTCRACHPAADAAFVEFQPHVGPHDRARAPFVYWAYRLMTLLLVATMSLFGVHAVLWMARRGLDRFRAGRAPGSDADPAQGSQP
ncbi:MAG: cytochrome c3 family protein [Gemmatimonadetes bacterium]|nr:cytochrome c3 family protein [Gemmatimonadota bacterium]